MSKKTCVCVCVVIHFIYLDSLCLLFCMGNCSSKGGEYSNEHVDADRDLDDEESDDGIYMCV